MEELDLSHINRLYSILLLKDGPKHGYEIIKDIEEMRGKKPSTSHIYPFLEDLREKGLVETREEGNRGKKVYSFTEEGEELVEERVSEFGKILQAAIENDIEECAHCGCQVYDGGYSEDGTTYCCKHCAEASG
ncbi:MAG: PadR family transcriptional regulator [Candidatus Nanosalina sp.]